MDKGVRFNNRTVHVSYTKYEHSESDSECRFSCNTTSTDSTTLRRRNRNLKLAIQSLKSTINLLTSGTVKYMDSYVETLEKKVNIKKLKSKGQMRNSEKLLKDTTIFLTDRVKAMRKTMLKHRVKTEQVLEEVENLLNDVEEQNEPQHSDFQTLLSPMKDLNDSPVNYDQLKNEKLESTTASPSSSPLDHEDANIQSYQIKEYLDTEEQEIDPVPSYTFAEESMIYKGVRFNNRTVHVSYTKYEHSESDSECRFSCNTTSTDSTTLRRRNRNLKLAIQSLKSTINLLTSGTVKYMDSYVETLEKKVNIKKLKSKGQMRNSEKLLKDTTIFLTDRVKTMRKTMLEHRVKTEQVLEEVENLLNGVEEQNEPQHSDFQTFLSPMEDMNHFLVNNDQWKNERLESTTASPNSSPLDHEDGNIQSYRIVEYLDTEEQVIDPVPSEESYEIVHDFTNNFGFTSNISSPQVSPLEIEEIGIEPDDIFLSNTRFTIQPNSPSNVHLPYKEMELPPRRHSQIPISTRLQEQMPSSYPPPLKVQKNTCCICQ